MNTIFMPFTSLLLHNSIDISLITDIITDFPTLRQELLLLI